MANSTRCEAKVSADCTGIAYESDPNSGDVILKGKKVHACGYCRKALGIAAIGEYSFIVSVQLEPMSGTKSTRKYARKAEFIAAVESVKGGELEYARKVLSGKPVSVSIDFRLWIGDEKTTNTVGLKDLDNLSKLVLDSLQTMVDAQGKMEGLGIIRNDNDVFRIVATKKLVEEKREMGVRLTVAKFAV